MSTLRTRVRSVLRRPVRQQVELGRAGLALIVFWMALRVVPFRRVVAWTDRPASSSDRFSELQPLGRGDLRTIWAVRVVARRLFPNKPCLVQALAARYLLHQRGTSSTLRIGIQQPGRPGDGPPEPARARGLAAHAWLERNGEVILGGAESPLQYQPLT